MNYLSICSGIEAASVAWHDIPGWVPVGFSEIEPFPCAVLAHRFPNVPNYGDMTKFKNWKHADKKPDTGTAQKVEFINAIRPDSESVFGNSDSSGSSLRGLPKIDGKAGRGSRSRNRKNPGDPVSSVQHTPAGAGKARVGAKGKGLPQVAFDFSAVDILVGGTPCQSFSVAGLRGSLDDARGNLTLTYVKILDHIDEERNLAGRPPAICVWENVPGVLSTKDNAFGCFLGALAGSDGELQPPDAERGWSSVGYVRGPRRAIAWRILDAQYFGVAQRRRRVFVVACSRKGTDPSKILFERESMRWDNPPSREAGEGVTGTISARTQGSGGLGTDFDLAGGDTGLAR